MRRDVEFTSEGATLRGRLYLSATTPQPAPVVVMAHGFSATARGMVADRYAEVFEAAGFAALLFDHRGFGLSGGEPRCQINVWMQTRGYLDAIAAAAALPEVDESRIAVWGDSLSASVAVAVGAIDDRVGAVIGQVPAFGDELSPPDDGSVFEQIRHTVLDGDITVDDEHTAGPLPVVSPDPTTMPSLLHPITAFRWFIEYGGRYGTGWVNNATVALPATPVRFNPVACIPHLDAALLLVIAEHDEMEGADSDVARQAFALAAEPKQLVEVEGGHFGLLHHPGTIFDSAGRAQAEFLREQFG